MNKISELDPRERFLRACRREPVDRVPAWLMRQAGRYMSEYQAIRSGCTFLELCKDPELCREVTMQPIDILGLEVGIIFSDILLPAEAMGLNLTFEDKKGPQLSNPVRDRAAVEALVDFDAAVATPWPAEAIKLTKEPMGDRPLIGFCGAPFTMASYMVEGKGSRSYENIKRMMFGEPDTFHLLMERITDNLIGYLQLQVDAGADAVQIFDSWGGCLSGPDYLEFAHPHTSRLIAAIKAKSPNIPIISYVNGCGHLLETMASAGADVLSIDWRVDPADARRRVGDKVALQGNMDPTALLATPAAAVREVRRNLREFGDEPGHIFNLGSGILQWTPVENVHALIKTLKE